jgi:signal transduction histidine kinase
MSDSSPGPPPPASSSGSPVPDSPPGLPPTSARPTGPLASPLATILVLALAVGITGAVYLKRQVAASRRAVEASLSSVMELKTGQISAWYEDYRADARALEGNPIVQARLRQFLAAGPAGSRDGEDIQRWIDNESARQRYRQLVLYDARGVPRLRTTDVPLPPDNAAPTAGPEFHAALWGGGVQAIDLEPASPDSVHFHLGFWIPVANLSGANAPALGAVLLEIDPDQSLFPLVQSWPAVSRTAETLLIRREGGYVVYLNRLRHRANTPLGLRISIDQRDDLPAAMAVSGRVGIVDGRDYRGVPVVAALHAIPGTPWFLVAKQDREETDGPMRQRVLAAGLVLLFLFVAAALGIDHLWRRRDVRLLQRQIAAEREHRRLEAMLQREQEFARILLENLSAGVVACNAEGKLTLFNRTARAWHGLDVMEVPPEEWARCYDLFQEDGITPMSAQTVPLARAFRGETVQDAGLVICARGQEPRAIVANAAPLHDTGGQSLGAVAVMHDITAQRRAEEGLRRAAEKLSQSNEEVRQFAYIVSHDLRSPLVNFRGFSTELRYSFAELDELVQEVVETLTESQRDTAGRLLRRDIPDALGFIDTAVARMDHLVSSLLRLSRVGHHELVPETVDLGGLVSGILAAMAAQIEEHGVDVTVHPLPVVTVDRAFLEQIMANILGNAVMYRDPSRPGRVEVSGRLAGSELLVKVSDNGRGIAEDDRDKVFAPFRRAGTPDVPGEGMGMAYVQAMVRRQGGRIWFDSEAGVGTTFSFSLPVVR